MPKVAVFVGSLSKDSINRKLAEAIGKLAAGRLEFTFSEISDLPLYNEDLWVEPPQSVLRMKAEIAAADAVLMVTPEFNRSFTPALKNAIDWGTRPWGDNSWAGKPAAVTGTSPGAIGAALAQNALKHLMMVVGTVLMGQPELYVTHKAEHFDADGNIVDEGLRQFIDGWIDSFARWIEMTTYNTTRLEAAE